MILPIHLGRGLLRDPNAKHTHALVELQGTVADTGLASHDNVVIGELTWVGEQKIPNLVIGNHRLEGKRVALSEPYLLLQRAKVADDASSSHQAVCYITHKYLFNKRPDPIVREKYAKTTLI